MHPDFICVGAMKAGTSSLAEWLAKHPYAAPPEFLRGMPIKETTYFSVSFDMNNKDRYAYLFRNVQSEQKSYEATADYFHTEGVPERIFNHNEKTKIIIMLRDPVERIWSHYFHGINYNNVESNNFMDAINRPHDTDYDNYHYAYLKIGRYAEHLKRWYGIFPPDQIAVLFSEDVWKDPGAWYMSLQFYIGLPVIYQLQEYNVYNKGKKQKMPAGIRQYLEDYYREYNEELADFLQITNPWRYNQWIKQQSKCVNA